MPDSVFVDTNVLLSGLIFKGNESRVLDMCIRREARLVLAQAVIDESRKVLKSKFPRHLQAIDDFLTMTDHVVTPYPAAATVQTAAALLRDPSDAVILASIIEAGPDVALSGDKDLLTDALKARFPIRTCAEYLRRVEAGG